MDDMKERYPDWARDTRLPVPPPPALSCDCQFHVYGDARDYPPKWTIKHELPNATFSDSLAMHHALGFTRRVLVHASVYDSDYKLLTDSLRSLPSRTNVRAAVVVNDDAADRDLQDLSDLGVCAGRFHITSRYERLSKDLVARTLARIRELGWHARLHVDPALLMDYGHLFDEVKDVDMVIDHLSHLDFSQGINQPAVNWMLDRIIDRGWWMLVSNGNRLSTLESGWDDAIPFARQFIHAAPDRMLWATDWPHVRWRKKRMMNDAEAVELFYRYVDFDADLIQKILVDNPARLHRF